MKNLQSNFKFLSFLILYTLAFIGCSSDDMEEIDDIITTSLFQLNAEGWTITGDAQGSLIEASYSPDGGIQDGYIYADDNVTGGIWYFTSPSSYHGNKTEYYGTTLSYSLFQNSNISNQFISNDIVFRNEAEQITYVYNSVSDYPTELWTDYSIEITAGNGWVKGEFDSGVVATEEDIKAVLANVTEFSIRGEFETGPDNGGIDNIIIR